MALSYQNLSVSNYFTIFLHYVFEVICVFITSVWLKYSKKYSGRNLTLINFLNKHSVSSNRSKVKNKHPIKGVCII